MPELYKAVLLLIAAFARLLIWNHRGSRMLTVGIAGVGFANLLAVGAIARSVDTWGSEELGRENLSGVLQYALMAVAFYGLSTFAIPIVQARGFRLRGLTPIWTVATAAALTVLIVTWLMGEGSRHPVHDLLALTDSCSQIFRATYALLLGTATGGTIVAAILALRPPGPPDRETRWTLHAMLVFSALGFLLALGVGYLIVRPDPAAGEESGMTAMVMNAFTLPADTFLAIAALWPVGRVIIGKMTRPSRITP